MVGASRSSAATQRPVAGERLRDRLADAALRARHHGHATVQAVDPDHRPPPWGSPVRPGLVTFPAPRYHTAMPRTTRSRRPLGGPDADRDRQLLVPPPVRGDAPGRAAAPCAVAARARPGDRPCPSARRGRVVPRDVLPARAGRHRGWAHGAPPPPSASASPGATRGRPGSSTASTAGASRGPRRTSRAGSMRRPLRPPGPADHGRQPRQPRRRARRRARRAARRADAPRGGPGRCCRCPPRAREPRRPAGRGHPRPVERASGVPASASASTT